MMELFVMEKRVLNTAGCGSYPCYQCTKKDECGWCGDSSQGVCQAKDSACKVTVITDKAHCSSVAASVSQTEVPVFTLCCGRVGSLKDPTRHPPFFLL